jgi:hypothetical protein
MKTVLLTGCLFAFCAVITVSCNMPFVKPISLPETGATLEGTIKFEGETVHYALVVVTDGKSFTSNGRVLADGTYKVENVPLGEVMIAVNTDAGTGDFQTAVMSGGRFKGPEVKGKGEAKGVQKFVKVPKKYFDPVQSGIKTTIQKGTNTFNIDIKETKK